MPLSARRSFARRMPRGLFGSIGFDGGPFIIAEFVAHDSRLQFRSLNHVRDDTLKPHWSSGAANALNLLCFRRHSGVGRTCNWFDPVANDPLQESAA